MDPFTIAYIEAALWSSLDESDEQDGDIAPETLARILNDCEAFQQDHADDIGSELERAGHDFWLTRNGHGAGFWDGDWEDEIGQRLTEASDVYGSVDLYVGDDGLIYS